MSRLKVNRRSYSVNAAPDTPLLWVLREDLQFVRHQIWVRTVDTVDVAQCT